MAGITISLLLLKDTASYITIAVHEGVKLIVLK